MIPLTPPSTYTNYRQFENPFNAFLHAIETEDWRAVRRFFSPTLLRDAFLRDFVYNDDLQRALKNSADSMPADVLKSLLDDLVIVSGDLKGFFLKKAVIRDDIEAVGFIIGSGPIPHKHLCAALTRVMPGRTGESIRRAISQKMLLEEEPVE